jgi:RecB family exonuclease
VLYLSNSEINTYLDCPRRWYFSYYLGLKKKDDGSEQTTPLTYGTRIHEALEGWYIPDESARVNPREAIRTIYAKEEPLVASAGGDMAKYADDRKSSFFLVDYYMDKVEKEGLDYGLNYVAAEAEYSMQLDEGIIFRGKMDAVVERESDGSRLVVDHKTYKSPTQAIQVAHLDGQLLGYMLLYRENNEDRLSGAMLNIFKKVKTTRAANIIQREFVRHTELETDNYAKRLRVIANDILKLKNKLDDGYDPYSTAYPHVTVDCTWKCPFLQACGLCDDGSDIEGYLKGNYTKHDVNARYVGGTDGL